jgi:hypothetical protein
VRNKMESYHNDQALKQKYVNRMQAHIDADELIRGIGYENGRGCAIGGTLNKYEHEGFPKELGLPVWLAHLADFIFENLPDDKYSTFPLKLLQAIPIGVDVEPVRHRLAILRLTPLAEANPSVREVIISIITLHQRALANNPPTDDEWSAARSAAYSAARSAADSAARSAAYSAAWSADSAAYRPAYSAAWSAAYSAAWSAAWSAARSADSAARSSAITKEAQNLILLLKELK